ncbi:MAG TPA: type I methionyl aminopeptidase [Acidimicrobiia bacterium]|nr:type I methionyl aminopeptidase [Acidimicrobiia bacterium]
MRRRVASVRRADGSPRPRTKPGRLSPDRTVPASIPRPPYAPDAPALVPAVPPDEFPDRMRAAGHAGREVLLELQDAVRVGMTTDELDRICHEACIARGGYPSPLHYKGFPKSLCTSVNDVICHGIPDDRVLEDGDIVNCDVTIYLHGVHGDTNATFLVGDVDDEGRRLMQVTKEAMWRGIDAVKPGARLNEIGRAIQEHAEGAGFSVVRSFVGHGVGEEFHTAPAVPHYFDPHSDLVLTPGLTFTIEPMINEGGWELGRIWPDGWTAPTKDGSRSAQFEHTVIVTGTGVEVCTILPGEPHGS